jgi:hypothetical protein
MTELGVRILRMKTRHVLITIGTLFLHGVWTTMLQITFRLAIPKEDVLMHALLTGHAVIWNIARTTPVGHLRLGGGWLMALSWDINVLQFLVYLV